MTEYSRGNHKQNSALVPSSCAHSSYLFTLFPLASCLPTPQLCPTCFFWFMIEKYSFQLSNLFLLTHVFPAVSNSPPCFMRIVFFRLSNLLLQLSRLAAPNPTIACFGSSSSTPALEDGPGSIPRCCGVPLKQARG